MFNDTLKNWAVASQALGLTLIVWLETSLGRGQAGFWQQWVLIVMLLCAGVVAVLRMYRYKRQMKEQERRRSLLADEASDEEQVIK